MLTENRKRQRCEGDDDDDDVQMPQAKRLSSALKSSEAARESWESESSSSECSWMSSPEHAAGSSSSSSGVDIMGPHSGLGPCSPLSASMQPDPVSLLSYQHINRVLREAHFHSLQSRAHSKHR